MHLPSNGHFWLGRVEAHCLGLIAHWEGWETLTITSHNHLETKGGRHTRVQRSFLPSTCISLNSRISSWELKPKSTDQSHCSILWHHTKHSRKLSDQTGLNEIYSPGTDQSHCSILWHHTKHSGNEARYYRNETQYEHTSPWGPEVIQGMLICDRIWEKGPLRVVSQIFQFLAIFTIQYLSNHQ